MVKLLITGTFPAFIHFGENVRIKKVKTFVWYVVHFSVLQNEPYDGTVSIETRAP